MLHVYQLYGKIPFTYYWAQDQHLGIILVTAAAIAISLDTQYLCDLLCLHHSSTSTPFHRFPPPIVPPLVTRQNLASEAERGPPLVTRLRRIRGGGTYGYGLIKPPLKSLQERLWLYFPQETPPNRISGRDCYLFFSSASRVRCILLSIAKTRYNLLASI